MVRVILALLLLLPAQSFAFGVMQGISKHIAIGGGQSYYYNFQPTGSTVPDGYTKVDGSRYPTENTDYGWVGGNYETIMRDRGVESDQRKDTNATPVGSNLTWVSDIVQNGSYSAVIVVGDPSYSATNTVIVEGTTVISSQATSAGAWYTYNGTVTVSDGQLTVQVNDGTRICYIDLVSQ